MSRLDQFRQAFPQFKDASDSELIGQISRYAKMPYEEVATVLGVAAPSGASEVGRQFMGGLVVDAPKQFGQAAQYLQRERDVYADQVRAEAAAGEEPSWWQRGLQKMSPFYSVGLEAFKAQALSETPTNQRTAPTPLERWGRETEAAAERRAPAYTPDTRGQGVVGDILSSGARGVGAAVPGLVTSVVVPPVGAAVMVAQYGGSSAEETYRKVKAAGGTDEEALHAARMSGAVQGGLETATNLLTMGLAKPAKELGKGVMSALTKGGTVAATTKGVAKALTEPNVYREVGKAWLKSAAANTITEPIQDLATREIEAQYGVTPDASALDTAIESAKGGLGMSILLGPLFLGGGRARAKRAATLKSALYGKNVPPEIRAQAQDLVMSAAREKGVPEQDVDKWFEAQLEIEDARNAALQNLEGDKTAASDMDLQDEVLLERRVNQLVAANTIGQLGLSGKKERNKKEQKKFEAKRAEDFNAAYNEPSGRFVTDEAGNERELTAGEALAMDAGLTLEQAAAQVAEDTKPANAAEQKTPLFTPQEKLYLEKVGPIKGAKGMAIFTEIENSELTEDQKLPLYTLLSQSKFEQARKNLGAMLYAKPTEVTADASTTTATEPVAPRSLPDGGSDLLGGVGDTGLVSAGQAGVPAGDTGAGVSGGQVSPVPVRAAEPAANLTSTPVASLLTSPNAAQEAALLTPSAPGTFTPRAYVAPETGVADQQTVAPSATPEVSLTAEDMGDIATMTGQGNLAAAAAEEERQAPATQDVNLDAVIAQRFSKGKNKERDAKILRAYITQLKADPAVDKTALQKAIADEFGVTPARVRQIGNPMEMTRAAEALGLDQQAVLDAMGVDSATKGEVDQIGKLQNEMASLRKQLKGATAEKRQEIADKMAVISEQVQKAKESAEQDRAATYSAGLTDVGVESAAGQTAGFGFDEDRMWADLEGEDAATSELVNLSSQIGSLTEALADFEAQNNRLAVLQTKKMIADAQARVDELVQSVVQKAKAPKAKKVKEAPSAYEEEQNRIREEKAAAARAERAAELERHRRGFNEGDRVSNAKLGEGTVVGFEDAKADTKIKIKFDSGETKTLSLQVAKLEKTRAVQKPSTTQVPVREGAGAGQEVGKGNAQKRQAASTREAKGQTQEKILTDSEAAAQAWDKEARTYEGAPMFDELTAEQQQEFIDYGSDNWAPSDVSIMLAKVQKATVTVTTDQQMRKLDVNERAVINTDTVSFRAMRTTPDQLRKAKGIDEALKHYENIGLGHLADQVDYWLVAEDSVDFDAAVFPVGDKRALAIRSGVITNDALASLAVSHELGHVADSVFGDVGAYSSDPRLNVRIVGEKAKGMGQVAREITDYVDANPDSPLGQHFKYPTDVAGSKIKTSDRVREELFAQLWAARADKYLAEDLAEFTPIAFEFVEAVYAAEQTIASESTGAAQAPALAETEAKPAAGKSDLRAQGRSADGQARFSRSVIDRNVKKLPKALQDPVLNSIEALMDVKGKGLDLVVFTNTLVDRAVKAGIPAAEKLSRLINAGRTDARNLEREAEKIADMYADVPDEFRGTGDESVNRFLFDSTRAGKWGYGKYADKDMAARFNAFDEKTQEFIKAIFEHGDKMLALKKKTVLDTTVSEYDAMIAKAKADGDSKTESKLLDEKKNVLKRYETLFRIREGKPYAPIKRDGNYFVVAKSQAYLVAEAADDKAKLKELEKSGDDYHVSFVDSKAEARTLRRQLEEQGAFESVEFAERDAAVDELFSNTTALRELTKIRAQVDQQAKDGDKSASKLLSVVNKMYLNALAEGSARQSEMRRRGVDGEVDMLHSFTRQARADAYFLSSLKTYPQVQQALQEMRSQARTGDRGRKSELKNELVRRYLQTLDPVDRPWINKMTRMSSLWYLATSPAYYLQNLTQTVIMSLPVMAGRHQYAKSSAALFKAYSELGGVISSGKLLKQQFDFDKVPADVREAIQELVNRGRIDIGMETEMGEFRVEGDGYIKEKWNKVDKALRLAVQKVESINRLSTAIAAYRLELEKTGDAKQALDYADRILVDTHGDYSAFNAPRAFNTGAGKVVLQFRKFQLIQLAYYAKMINTSDMNAVEKAAARKALGYSLAHTAAFAGLMGVPGYSAIAWALAALFGDDDDETPPTMQVRKYLVDSFGETTANMILRGAPTLAGMDISGKVGAGNIFSIMPFSKADLTTTAGRYQAIGELGGAAVGLGVRMADGVVLMAQGDWYKGLEQLLPKGVSDALKAYRFASEGVTRRNQDVVLPADEVSSLDTVWKSLGISPTKQSVMYEKADALKTMRDKLQSDAQQLQRDFLKAYKANDSAAIAEIRQEWFKLQGRRVKAGFARQPVTYLTRAPMEQRKRERNTMGGVQYQKSERRAVENLR